MSHKSQNFEPQFEIDFHKVATFIVFLLLMTMLMCSCGPARHLKLADKHIAKAKAKGARVDVDTVYKDVMVFVPEVRIDTVFTKVNFTDTLTFIKDRVITRLKIDTLERTVFVETICPPDTVRVEVAIPCKTVKAGATNWDLVVLALCCLLAGFGIGLWQMARKSV